MSVDGFERLPSPETLIAQPVKGNQEEKQKILKKCHEIIKKVKEVLSDKQEMKKMLDKVSKENERPGEEYKSRRLERIKMLCFVCGFACSVCACSACE